MCDDKMVDWGMGNSHQATVYKRGTVQVRFLYGIDRFLEDLLIKQGDNKWFVFFQDLFK